MSDKQSKAWRMSQHHMLNSLYARKLSRISNFKQTISAPTLRTHIVLRAFNQSKGKSTLFCTQKWCRNCIRYAPLNRLFVPPRNKALMTSDGDNILSHCICSPKVVYESLSNCIRLWCISVDALEPVFVNEFIHVIIWYPGQVRDDGIRSSDNDFLENLAIPTPECAWSCCSSPYCCVNLGTNDQKSSFDLL